MKNHIDLVILCGGKGSRLGKLTKKTPKPLINVAGKPFIEHLFQFYQKYNFRNIYLLAGYKGNIIKKFYHQKKRNFININVLIEKKPLGTAGCLSLIRKKLSKNFLMINGDSFVDFDSNKFLSSGLKKNYKAKILLVSSKTYRSNKKLLGLDLKKNNQITYSSRSTYMNAGVYLFDKSIFSKMPKTFISLEDDILPDLINKNFVEGQKTDQYFIDIGIKKNLNIAKKTIKKKFLKPALILDRDGVINYDFGYVYKPRNFKFMKGTIRALKYLSNKKIYIFIVTNQSGIARGYYNEKDFINLHKYLKKKLSLKKIFIHDVKYCLHHPKFGKGKFKKKCSCRKPGNKMIQDILNEWNIKKSKSLMIGDQTSDKQCANKSNIKFKFRDSNLYDQIKMIVKN